MTPEKLLCQVAKILEKLKIPYIVTGGFAVSVWGKPRFTADIDIVVEILPPKISLLAKNLLSIDKDVYVDGKAIQDALKNKGEFNFIHPQSGLKIDFWIKRYPFEKFERGIPKKIGKQKIIFISPEDLILSKLIWYKETESTRHLEDIISVMEISKVDLKYLKQWASCQSTIEILNKILEK